MTFKQWVVKNRPECISSWYVGEVSGCPFDYGLEKFEESCANCVSHNGYGCHYCWNRKMKGRLERLLEEKGLIK